MSDNIDNSDFIAITIANIMTIFSDLERTDELARISLLNVCFQLAQNYLDMKKEKDELAELYRESMVYSLMINAEKMPDHDHEQKIC